MSVLVRPKFPDWCWLPNGKRFLHAHCRVRMIRYRVWYIP